MEPTCSFRSTTHNLLTPISHLRRRILALPTSPNRHRHDRGLHTRCQRRLRQLRYRIGDCDCLRHGRSRQHCPPIPRKRRRERSCINDILDCCWRRGSDCVDYGGCGERLFDDGLCRRGCCGHDRVGDGGRDLLAIARCSLCIRVVLSSEDLGGSGDCAILATSSTAGVRWWDTAQRGSGVRDCKFLDSTGPWCDCHRLCRQSWAASNCLGTSGKGGRDCVWSNRSLCSLFESADRSWQIMVSLLHSV
jgi:hypothetical protein